MCDRFAISGGKAIGSGFAVIANLDNDNVVAFRRWSFLGECPIPCATLEKVHTELKSLVLNPKRRGDLHKSRR